MSDKDQKSDQELVPAQTGALPKTKPSEITLTADGKGGVKITLAADKPKTDENKKKMPRGSTVFRHA